MHVQNWFLSSELVKQEANSKLNAFEEQMKQEEEERKRNGVVETRRQVAARKKKGNYSADSSIAAILICKSLCIWF